MNLSQIGLIGQRIDVLNGGDVHPDGHLLTIAEIQHALRALSTDDPPAREEGRGQLRSRLRLAASQPGYWRGSSSPEQQTSLFPVAVPTPVEASTPTPSRTPAGGLAEAAPDGAQSTGRHMSGPTTSPANPGSSRVQFPDLSERITGADTATAPVDPADQAAGSRSLDEPAALSGTRGDTSAERPAQPVSPVIPGGDTPARPVHTGGDARPAAMSPLLTWGRADAGGTLSGSVPKGGPPTGPPAEGPPPRNRVAGTPRLLQLDRDWIVGTAAHGGAGVTSVVVLLADAAAAAGRGVHLIDTSRPSRSGLVGVPTRELGLLDDELWRRGTRPGVTVDRPSSDVPPTGWPEPPSGPTALALPNGDRAETVVDLGLPEAARLLRLAAAGCRTVVVGRCTVPGVHAVERQLAVLGTGQAVVALIGPARWPGAVRSSAGPLLTALHDRGRVVAVPVDRRLQDTGLTAQPMPRALLKAGHGLLAQLDQLTHTDQKAHPDGTRPGPTIPGADRATTERTL